MQLSLIISRLFASVRSFAGWNRQTIKELKNDPTIIFTFPDGRKLTMEELQGVTGQVAFRDGRLVDVTGTVRHEIIGKGAVPVAAESLHQQARDAGGLRLSATILLTRYRQTSLAAQELGIGGFSGRFA